MSKIVCIIPARLGSKRIPGKNTKRLLGKPLIEYTLDTAIASNIFNKIYISTNDRNMQDKIYKSSNYEILIRNNGFSDDQTTCQEALLGSLDQIEKEKDEKYDIVVQLLATCPLRTNLDIIRAYNYFIEKGLDFLITSSEYIQHPYWAFNSQNTSLFPVAIKMRSQDLPVYTCPNGAIWIAKVKELKEQKTFYGKGVHLFPIKFEHGIDIDTMEDFERAEMIMQYQKSKENFKSIEDVLVSYPVLKKKLKKDELDIKDMEREEIKSTEHKLAKPNEWLLELDSQTIRQQKINSKKRSFLRNVKMCNNIKNALSEIENEKYFQIIKLQYFENKNAKEIKKILKLTDDEFKSEKDRLMRLLKILLEV